MTEALIPKSPLAEPVAQPWWREATMWLVVGGPTLVVIASFITLGLALHYPDPVLNEKADKATAQVPAMKARNHAATGVR